MHPTATSWSDGGSILIRCGECGSLLKITNVRPADDALKLSPGGARETSNANSAAADDPPPQMTEARIEAVLQRVSTYLWGSFLPGS